MDELPDIGWNWGGGHYELELWLGSRSRDRLLAALEALWAHRTLAGPYADRDGEPPRRPLSDPSSGLSETLFGRATLPGGARVPCSSVAIRAEDYPSEREEDILIFSVPVNGLEEAWRQVADFPWGEAADDRRWQQPLENWFADIAGTVFARVPCRLGWVGFEVTSVSDGAGKRWLKRGIPAERSIGVLRPDGDGLSWYPPTESARTGIDWSKPPSRREVLLVWRAALRMSLPSRSPRRALRRERRSEREPG